ncbi:phosphotransferase [Candidatus Berkiella aquae]|uniref:Aminoglycoside phosphotransferase family protein n=1 Tax=Candidatus Berkiella aquae TaxID=295108 RepID=A0A0Q9YM63_9GAMM|nr:aminoglycoside phosphotransferase family protein [Candidatus Berkiella aquae]MCS5710532.1 aminoglycoside phosphotransferase family protein [Candidatus Berkiella aquae]
MQADINPTYLTNIEAFYDIRIKACINGPQQFVAKTYILTDENKSLYFCKVINNELLAPGIMATLPVVEEMYQKGIENISYPIRGGNCLYLLQDDTLIVLYDYIEVKQSFDYSPFALGKNIAKVHAISPRINAKAPIESFTFPNKALFMQRMENTLNSQSTDPVIQALKSLLQMHEAQNQRYIAELETLGEQCQKKHEALVITHGDIATNILVKTPDDIYIIDWDEMRLAPAERDLWMKEEVAGFLEGYQSVRPDFQVDKTYRRFCILQYYFERMNLYFSDILNTSASDDFRLKRIERLAQGKMAGWNLHKVEVTP